MTNDDRDSDHGPLNGRAWTLGAVLAGLLAGLGGTAGYQTLNPPRPDPFRGTDGARLRAELNLQIANVRLSVAELKGEIDTLQTLQSIESSAGGEHRGSDWHRRAAEVVPALDATVRQLLDRVDRIDRHLDTMSK